MMIAIATGIGLQQKIRDKVVAFNGHASIAKYDTNNSQESQTPISINQEFYPNFTTVEGIKHIQAVASKSAIIRKEFDFEYIIVKGVGNDYNWTYFKDYLIEGVLPDYTKSRNKEILISEYLSKRLQIAVGDKVNTFFIKADINKPPSVISYEVVGVYNSGFKDFDELYIIGDIRHIQRLNKWKKEEIGNFEVFIEDYDELKRKGVEIFQDIPSELNSIIVTDKYPFVFEWIGIFDKNIYGIIGIMILVAGINMITALLVLILERTQMIGILKALGTSNLGIRKIFIYNASYLILLGLFWGNLIGLGLLFAQKYFGLFPLNPESYYVSTVPVYINVGYILLLNVGTFILCLLMLLIPSYIITRISPVKAIRFE
jgi:lipoprotein-releasing system permease protein